MYQRDQKFTYKDENADWQRETRGKLLISTFNMTNWVLVYTQRDEKIAQDFFRTLKTVAGPMGMQVSNPQQ